MKLPPYPKYKPSGVEWLGDVPQHWGVAQLRRSCVILDCMHRTVSFVDDGVPLASIREVHGSEVDLTQAKQTTEEEYLGLLEGGRQPRLGDIIYSRNATVGDASIVTTTERFAMGQDVCLIRSGAQNPKFMLYLIRSEPLLRQLESFVIGATFRRINVGQIKTFWVCWPEPAEQGAIADFLDREAAKIDALIEKKRTLIERLKEKRTALISRTVTRGLPPDAARTAGLDPHPKLKASGIGWLGDIPEHWEVRQFRYLIQRLDQGWSPVAGNSPAVEGEWGVLKLSAVRNGRFLPSENKVLPDDLDNTTAITPRSSDVLISRANTPDRVGDVALVVENHTQLLIPDLIYRVQVSDVAADPAFVCHFLLSRNARALIEADARGSSGSMVKLGQGHLRSWRFPCPPIIEQRAISDFLERQSEKIDQMTLKVEAAIERLLEYRGALITAAVTGKIDVRGVAAEATQ